MIIMAGMFKRKTTITTIRMTERRWKNIEEKNVGQWAAVAMNMMRMECQGSNTIGIALFPITLSFGVVVVIIILTASLPLFLLFCFSALAQTYEIPYERWLLCVCVSPLFVCLNDKFTIYYWFRCYKNSKLHFHLLFLLCVRSFCLLVVALHLDVFPLWKFLHLCIAWQWICNCDFFWERVQSCNGVCTFDTD